jgi:precorrin-2 methylase
MILPMQHMAGISSNQRLESVLEKMMETQNMILSRLSAEDFEEEEEEEHDMIGGLMKSPEVQAMIVGGITKLFNMGADKSVAVAGVTELNEDEVFTIVNSLMNKGVTIEHLRKLDEMNSMKLNSLLLML